MTGLLTIALLTIGGFTTVGVAGVMLVGALRNMTTHRKG